MGAYIARRLIWTLFVIVGITLFTFTISHLIPADPARLAAGIDATEDQVAIMREMMGLNRPIPEQYGRYLVGLARGDLGISIRNRRSVAQDIRTFFPATLELTALTMLVYVLLGVPLGVLAALRRGRPTDFLLRFGAVAGDGMPSFWLALVLQLLFFRELGWLPSGGRLDPIMDIPPHVTGLLTLDSLISGQWPAFWDVLHHMVLPTIALVLGRLAVAVRITRRSFLTVLGQDYIRTARAKGLEFRSVVWRHAMKNALIPIVTILSLQVGWLLSGTVLIEIIFSWPGLGRYALESIAFLDFPAIMGVTLVVSLVFVLINLVVDVLYTFLDPRIQY
jgi:peptide/nickel transport system permease protein